MIFREWLLWQRDRGDYLGLAVRDTCTDPGWLLQFNNEVDFFLKIESLGFGALNSRVLTDAFTDEWHHLYCAHHYSLNLPWGPSPRTIASIDQHGFEYERSPEWRAGMERLFGKGWRYHQFGWMPKDRPGYVYVMRTDNGFYKLGRTKNLDSRFKAVDLVVPFEMELIRSYKTDDCYELERQYHMRFAECHVKGEWFRIDEEAFPFADVDEVTLLSPAWNDDVPDEFLFASQARRAA